MGTAAAVQSLGERLRGDANRLLATTGGDLGEALRAVQRLVELRLQWSPAARIAREPDAIDAFDLTAYEQDLTRLAGGEPLAYILGLQPFQEHVFVVTPAVLIPRPDTEILVARALRHLPAYGQASVLDLGTGSGCIAICLALERPHVDVMAVDASPDALQVARLNAQRLRAERVRFLESDWFDAVAGERFDLIVANPPYVAAGDAHLADLRHEPETALVAGADGLDHLRHIVAAAGDHLLPGGALMVEHGYDQRNAVLELFRRAGFSDLEGIDDLAGRARVVVGRFGRWRS